jgi:imidazolonepropionase-like amidohydrolase
VLHHLSLRTLRDHDTSTRYLVFDRVRQYLVQADLIWVSPGCWLKPGWILIHNGVVQAHGQTGRDPWPNQADEVHFLDDVILIPSLIDAHVHLGLDSGSGSDPVGRAEYAASWGMAGVRDGGDRPGGALEVRHQLERHLHVAASGTALFKPGRYGSFLGRPVKDKPDMIDLVDDLSKAGVDQIKILASGPVHLDFVGRVGPPQFSPDELNLIVNRAKQNGLSVMAHANGAEAVRLCCRAGVATVEHGYFMGNEVLAELRDAGISWIPTIEPLSVLALREKDNRRRRRIERIIEGQLEQLARANEIGVVAVLGTDAGSPGVICGPALYREMSWWRTAGLSYDRIFEAGTARPADLLGWSDRIGRLVPGCEPKFTGLHLNERGEPMFSGTPALVAGPRKIRCGDE